MHETNRTYFPTVKSWNEIVYPHPEQVHCARSPSRALRPTRPWPGARPVAGKVKIVA